MTTNATNATNATTVNPANLSFPEYASVVPALPAFEDKQDLIIALCSVRAAAAELLAQYQCQWDDQREATGLYSVGALVGYANCAAVRATIASIDAALKSAHG